MLNTSVSVSSSASASVSSNNYIPSVYCAGVVVSEEELARAKRVYRRARGFEAQARAFVELSACYRQHIGSYGEHGLPRNWEEVFVGHMGCTVIERHRSALSYVSGEVLFIKNGLCVAKALYTKIYPTLEGMRSGEKVRWQWELRSTIDEERRLQRRNSRKG